MKKIKKQKPIQTIKSGQTPIIETSKTTFPKQPEIKKIELENKFTLHINKEVREKIEYICNKICNIEWSGVLFYKIQGDLTDIDQLVVTPIDLFPLDIGNSVATEYEYDNEYIKYRSSNPELLEDGVFVGHVH